MQFFVLHQPLNDENFAVLLPDDLVKSDNRGCLKQMLEEFEEGIDAILAVEKISLSESKKYGIIDPGKQRGRIIDVNGIIEKPLPEEATSEFGVVGRYVFTQKFYLFWKVCQPEREMKFS